MEKRLRRAKTLGAVELLNACRSVTGTRFFSENRLDREEVAYQLADYLQTPSVGPQLYVRSLSQYGPVRLARHEVNPPDVFLSYFHADVDFANRLVTAIADAGHVVWYDQNGLTAGDPFPLIIERALELVRFVAVVATAMSVERPWVKREVSATYVRETEEDRSILIPLKLDESRLPLFMRSRQWCDFTSSFDNGLAQFLALLQGVDQSKG